MSGRQRLMRQPEPEPTPCPECRQGKCQNCTDMVLNDNDDLEPCPCKEAGHTTGATT